MLPRRRLTRARQSQPPGRAFGEAGVETELASVAPKRGSDSGVDASGSEARALQGFLSPVAAQEVAATRKFSSLSAFAYLIGSVTVRARAAGSRRGLPAGRSL